MKGAMPGCMGIREPQGAKGMPYCGPNSWDHAGWLSERSRGACGSELGIPPPNGPLRALVGGGRAGSG